MDADGRFYDSDMGPVWVASASNYNTSPSQFRTYAGGMDPFKNSVMLCSLS